MNNLEGNSRQTANPPEHLSATEIALARGRAYLLFHHLYLEGLTGKWLPVVQKIPDLAEFLPERIEPDQIEAQHYDLFGVNVLPYESVFLEPSGRLGGEITQVVQQIYTRLGYTPDSSTSADHLGEALGLLAFLCGAEADAWEDGQTEIAARMQRFARDFLEAHLLCWIAPVIQAVRHEQHPLYTAVADLTLELVASHYLQIAAPGVPPRSVLFTTPVNFLQHKHTGLREIAEFLASPPNSGLFLSHSAITHLARWLNLPRGFGGRPQVLTNLLRAAAQYEQVPALVEQLDAVTQRWIAGYQADMAAFPVLKGFILPWLTQTANTQRLIAGMKHGAESLAQDL